MRMRRPRNAGFTLVEIMIVVAIIGSLAAIAVPNYLQVTATSRKNTCIANLKQLEGAKASWALENKALGTTVVEETDIVGDDNYIRFMPVCHDKGTYDLGRVMDPPTCTVPGHELP